MRGIPNVFNTEQDIINSMSEDPEATKAKLRVMLDGRFAWFADRKLSAKETGITDGTHRVIVTRGEMVDDKEGPEERWQYELREDPNAWMFKIGLTVEKVNKYLEMEVA